MKITIKLLLSKILILLVFMGVGFSLTACDKDNLSDCTDCKIFLTANQPSGNLGGSAGADAACMADANYPGAGTYKALIVDANRVASVTANTGDGQVDWVLHPNTTYYRMDGTTKIMTTNGNGIFVFGTLTTNFGGANTWTGLSSDWTNGSIDCTNWTDGTNGVSGRTGNGSITNFAAISDIVTTCDVSRALYCVEQ